MIGHLDAVVVVGRLPAQTHAHGMPIALVQAVGRHGSAGASNGAFKSRATIRELDMRLSGRTAEACEFPSARS